MGLSFCECEWEYVYSEKHKQKNTPEFVLELQTQQWLPKVIVATVMFNYVQQFVSTSVFVYMWGLSAWYRLVKNVSDIVML